MNPPSGTREREVKIEERGHAGREGISGTRTHGKDDSSDITLIIKIDYLLMHCPSVTEFNFNLRIKKTELAMARANTAIYAYPDFLSGQCTASVA